MLMTPKVGAFVVGDIIPLIDYGAFAALRLGTIFTAPLLATYPWYAPVGRDSGFDLEYMGGMWDVELIDGVQFWFPEADPDKLGIVELCASGLVQTIAVRDDANPAGGTLVAGWAANANHVLDMLPFTGRGAARVRAGDRSGLPRPLSGRQRSSGFVGGTSR
jgi:hypothetical protein